MISIEAQDAVYGKKYCCGCYGDQTDVIDDVKKEIAELIKEYDFKKSELNKYPVLINFFFLSL